MAKRMISFRATISFFFLLILDLPTLVIAQCGSLVTYRQHADLLESAPQCLREGCSQEQGNSTISSPCPSTSPCSVYWNMFVQEFDEKNAWCSTCGSDLACRISGWPVLNATTLCHSTPNQLLFGDEGCCIRDNEPFELAEWTGALCNGSEWRQQFDICGGMACLDWREWIMPWNWTVHNDTRSLDEQECKAPSHYLGIYVVEHFFWVLVTLGFGCLRLWIARHEEAKQRNVLRYLLLNFWTSLKFTQERRRVVLREKMAENEDLRPPVTDKLRWGFPVIMGVSLAGVQLGFNFLAAHLIKSEPGYEHIPLASLALLFCCRPRLAWLSCLLAQLISESRLVKIFKFRPDGDGLWAAKLVLSSVAVGSAVSEAVMQLLGSYFLGRTAQVGAERGFYYIHHLRPMMWGRDARHMYLGALCWLMLCVPLVVVWFFIALFFSQVYDAVGRWRGSIFDFLNHKAPELAQGPVAWLLDYIDPGPTFTKQSKPTSFSADSSQPTIYNPPDQPFQVNPFHDQPLPYGGPGTGSLFDDQPLPVRHNDMRSHYAQSTQSEFTDQPMMVPRAASGGYRVASGGYAQHATSVQRRTTSGTQYNSLAQNDELDVTDVVDQPFAVSPRPPPRSEAIHGNLDDSHAGASLLAPSDHGAPPSSSGNNSSNQRADFPHGVSLKWKQWESKVIFAGTFLGILAYASQWVFWDGFVKASGDRFCPPSVWKVGGLWWGGSFLYVGIPFLGY